MNIYFKIFLLFISLLFFETTPGQLYTNSIVVGYYPAWLRLKLPAERIKFENLTHINHAFAWPEADGSISAYHNFSYPQLIVKAHNAGKQILVSLGGWGQSYGFSPMAKNPTARANFIENMTDFCLNHGYDGVDIDWEHPANVTDRNNLSLLIYQLRQAFNANDSTLLITMAVPAGSWTGQWFDYSTLKNYVDWFGCMTYDFHGSWSNHAGHNSPLYAPQNDQCGSVHSAIQYLLSTRGVPKEKILLGIPFYGKEFNAATLYGPSTGEEINYAYYDIQPKIGAGWTYHWDELSKVPYLTNSTHTKLITYDDTTSIRIKCDYASEQKLRGVMLWALGQDVIGDNQPLLETVGRTMGIPTDTNLTQARIAGSFLLLNNYPNPFNEWTIIPFYIARESEIKLEIFNILGQRISILVDERRSIGWYKARFSAEDIPAGEYLYRLSASHFSKTGKMILIK